VSTKKRHFKVKNFKKIGEGTQLPRQTIPMRHPILAPNSTFWIHLFFKTYSEMPILCKFFCNPSSQVFLKFQFTFVRILEFKHYNANSRVSGRDLISHLTARFEQRRDRKQNQRIFMAEHLLVAWHSRRTLVYVKPF